MCPAPDTQDRQALSQDDNSSREEFYHYYAEQSANEQMVAHFRRLRDVLLEIRGAAGGPYDILDIGCGAATFSLLCAERGHRVAGIDINEPLVTLARQRAEEAGHTIDFRIGSAAELPWPDSTFDICCSPELLEHVPNWERCLDEFTRVLRPGGVLFASTTNRLCPAQQEFNLPLYSWYPTWLKRRYEALSRTTRPELANYATYPAINWFTHGQLRRELERRGFRCLDRFDIAAMRHREGPNGMALAVIRNVPGLRLLGQLVKQGTSIVGIKKREAP